MQTLLIDRAEIAKLKQISKTVFDEVLHQHIREAQFTDLMPLIGEELYNDIITNTQNYNSLLNGGSYVYENKTYQNQGLKSVLVYYTYSRYAMFGDVVDTTFSLVNKLNGSESQRVADGTKKAMWQESRNTAYNLWLNVEKYLLRTNNPLYFRCRNIINQNNNFRFSKIC